MPSELNDLSVDVQLTAPARGHLLYRGATKWNNLAPGTSGHVLTSGGAGADPAWAPPPTVITDHGALGGLGDDDHPQYVLASGARAMIGALVLPGDPGSALEAAPKQYVDAQVATRESPLTFSSPLSRLANAVSLPAASGSQNGYLASGDWTTFNSKASVTYVDAQDALRLALTGGTLTGALTIRNSLTVNAAASGSDAQLILNRLSTSDRAYLVLQLSGAADWTFGQHPGTTTFELKTGSDQVIAAQKAGNVVLRATEANGPSSVGTIIDTKNSFTASGRKLISVRNAGVEKAFFDFDGQLSLPTTGSSAGLLLGTDWQIYRSAANVATMSGPLLGPNGSASAPTWSFSAQPGVGFYNAGSVIGVTFGATAVTNAFRNGMTISGDRACQWTSGNGDAATGTVDLLLVRDAANTLALRNVTAAQTFRIYNTRPDASNTEYASLGWAANVFTISPVATGTGTLRGMQLGATGTALGFLGATPIARQSVTGSRASGVALTNLLTALATMGLITDSTTV